MKLCMIGNRGHWGYVFESIREVPEVEITAVSPGCADNADNLIAKAGEFGFSPKLYSDYLQMLDTEKPDMAVVDGPFDLHATMATECLKRNIHVFCEKPIALTLSDLAMVEAAYQNSSAKIFSMIGLRYDAAFQTMLNLVKSGAIGKVKLISTRKSYRLGKRPDYYKTRATYGGTIPWVGSHAIDWIIAFSGCMQAAHIFAADTRIDNFDNGELEIAAECQFVMANGVLGQASIDFLRPAAAPTHGDDQARVGGTAGVIEALHGRVFLIDKDGEREVPTVAERQLFSDIVLDVMGKRPAITTPEETIALTRNCLLAQQTADRISR